MDIERALADGYTKDEVISELGRRTGMNYKQAMSDGYSVDDVIAEMNRRDSASSTNIADRKIVDTTNTPSVPKWGQDNPNLYGLLGATKELSGVAGEYAGMGLGAAAGGAVGGPMGVIAGAGTGYAATKALQAYLNGESPTIDSVSKDFAIGSSGQALPLVAGKIASLDYGGIAGKLSRKIMGIGDDVVSKIKAIKDSFGIEISAAEATGSRGLGLYESMLDKTPFSASIIDKHTQLKQLKPLLDLREKALSENNYQGAESTGLLIQKQVNAFVDKMNIQDAAKRTAAKNRVLEKMGSNETDETLALAGQGVLKIRSEAANAKKNDVFKAIGEYIPNEKVTTPELAKTAKGELERILKTPNQDPELIKNLRWASKTNEELTALMDEISGYPEQVQKQILEKAGFSGQESLTKRDWGALQDYRVQLNDLIKKGDASISAGGTHISGQTSGIGAIYKKLKEALDKDLETIAQKSGNEAFARLRAANAFYQQEYAPLWKRAKIIRDVASSNPAGVADVILQPKNVLEVDILRKAIGEEAFGKTIKPMITKKLLGKSEVFDQKDLASMLEKYGDETLSKIYAPQEMAFLKRIAAGEGIDLAGPIPIGMKSLINEISKRTPSGVVDAIIGTGNEKITNTSRLRENIVKMRAMLDNNALKEIKGELVSRLFKINQRTGYVEPAAFSNAVENAKPVLNILMKPEEVKWLNDISDVTKRITLAQSRASNPSGTAQNIIAWSAYGYIIHQGVSAAEDLKAGDFSGAMAHLGKAGIAVITPRAMAKIYLSDPGRKVFLEGLKTPVGTQKGAEIASKISAIITGDIATANNGESQGKR